MDRRVTPVELQCRRLALGLSQARLAMILSVKQSRVSDWERGIRTVPLGIAQEVARLEVTRDHLIDLACLAVDAVPDDEGAALFVYDSDAALAAAHPELDGFPFETHRVAMALAATDGDTTLVAR